MSRWIVSELTPTTWDPHAYETLLPSAFPASYAGPVVSVADVCTVLRPLSSANRGALVVAPGGTSRRSGRIERLTASKGQPVFRLEARGLELGDVLVPAAGVAPCVLIDERHSSTAFSHGYVALRPNRFPPVLLWALLSSRSGERARSAATEGQPPFRMDARSIGRIRLPALPHDRQARLVTRIRALLPEPPVLLTAESARTSRWVLVDVVGRRDWNPARVIIESDVEGGVRIDEIASVLAPRGVSRGHQLSRPAEGAVPVLTAACVTKGRGPSTWAPPGIQMEVAFPGDVVLTRIGPRHRVATPDAGIAFGTELLVIRCHDPAVAPALASYLASEGGASRVGALDSGTTIPRLTLDGVRSFPIPWPLPAVAAFEPADRRVLAERLEERLWS